MDTPMMEDFKESAELTDPSAMEKVFAIPLLFDQILKGFSTRDLFTLRSVCKAWNDSALSVLQKRDDFAIKLTLTTLMKNNPSCFKNKDRKILLRHVILGLFDEEWNAGGRRLQRFLELHHKHIVHLHLELFTPMSDFFRDVWNKWRLSKLEALVMEVVDDCYYDSQPQVPPYIAEKSSVTKLELWWLPMDPLISATPRLQELVIQIQSNTTLTRLTTTSLKVLDAILCTPEGPEIMNAFLRRPHSQGLEKLRICFDYLSLTSRELVFETPMPKLKELVLNKYRNDITVKNLDPGLFPKLESLNVSLEILDEDSLRSQEGRFEKLRELVTSGADKNENRKLGKLLSMCETAEVVIIHAYKWPRTPGHLSVVNKTLLNSLTSFGNLKELEMYIGFGLDADEEEVVTCSSLGEIEWQMMKLRNLADKGLDRLRLVVTPHMRREESPWPSCSIGDWGQSFCCGLISLAKVMKSIQIRGFGAARLFSPALEVRMRQAIQEDKLNLEVAWY